MRRRKWTLGGLILVSALLAGTAAGRQTNTTLTLPRGARVGILDLLDAEVTHLHTAKDLTRSFLKTHTVSWPVESMLADALRPRLAQLGFVGVSIAPSPMLVRNRDDFFIDQSVAKGLPRACATELAQLAASQHLDALIVLAPGLNNPAQAGGAVRRALPNYLRGWGFVTQAEGSGHPVLFDMTQLLLVGFSGESVTLSARIWDGGATDEWTDYVAPPDLRQMPPEVLNRLEPLFAAALSRQAGMLLEWLAVAP